MWSGPGRAPGAAIALTSTMALTAMVAASCSGPAEPPRSVVLITLDTTRADRLGLYGGGSNLTPHLDRFGAQGAVFERAIAQAAVTPVSHASILTGLVPYHHGLRVLHGLRANRLGGERETLAETLSERGYATAAFISAFPAGSYFGLAQGFDVFDEDFAADQPVDEHGIVSTGLNQRRGDETVDRALEWLLAAKRPFFLWVHLFDPHDPRLLPPESWMAERPPVAGDEPTVLRQLYDLEVAFMDEQIGRLLTAIDDRGEAPLVAIVADHGEGLGDHGWWTHGILYQEQIRVPMMLRGPGVPPGRRVTGLVRTVDLVPTVLDLLGTERPDVAYDGVSLLPEIRGGSRRRPPPAYADSLATLTYRFTPTISDRKDDQLFAVLVDRWKYIHHLSRPEESELYDLAADPGELHNSIAEDPDQASALRRYLESLPLLPSTGGRPPSSTAEEEEAARRLRALGYLE